MTGEGRVFLEGVVLAIVRAFFFRGATEGAKLTERLYEGMFLLDSNEASKGWTDLEGHITGLLEKNEARLEHSERWPDQRLATEIKGVKKGTYFLTYFNAPTQSIAGLRRDIELSDKILRFLVVQEDFLDEEMKRRKDQARRRAEQPASPPPAPAPVAEASAGSPAAATPEGESSNAEAPAATSDAPSAETKEAAEPSEAVSEEATEATPVAEAAPAAEATPAGDEDAAAEKPAE